MEQYLFENLLLLLLMLFIYVNEIIFLSIAVVEAMSFDFFLEPNYIEFAQGCRRSLPY